MYTRKNIYIKLDPEMNYIKRKKNDICIICELLCTFIGLSAIYTCTYLFT